MPASAAPKHKETNKFRFKTFAERLSEINIDVVHQIKRVPDTEDSEDFSKFRECFLKWASLDHSKYFTSFKEDVSKKCKNYKMVVHYKDELISNVERHLLVKDSLALQALLEHLVALCVDLGKDFYCKFPTFFHILTDLLSTSTQEPQSIECIFTTMTLLFRHLWRYMVNDMENVLEMYANLLTGQHPTYVAMFAAESISFLLRKAKDSDFVLGKLFSLLETHSADAGAVGRVLYNMLKSPQNQFHSVTEKCFPVILSFVKLSGTSNPDLTFNSINVAINLMAKHTRKQFAKFVWQIMINEIVYKQSDIFYMTNLVKLLITWCKVQGGSRLVSDTELLQSLVVCMNALGQSCQDTDYLSKVDLFRQLCDLVSTVLLGSKSGVNPSIQEEMVSLILKNEVDFETVVGFWKTLFPHSDFRTIFLKMFLKFSHDKLQVQNFQLSIIKLIAEYALFNTELPRNESELAVYKPFDIDFSLVSRQKTELKPCNVITSTCCHHTTDCASMWYCLVAIQHIRPAAANNLATVEKLLHHLLHQNQQNEESLCVLSMTCQTLVILDSNYDFQSEHDIIVKLVEKWPTNRNALFMLSLILSRHEHVSSILNEDSSKFQSIFENNVSSANATVRLFTLRILQHIDSGNTSLYAACIQAEETPASVHDIRKKLIHLNKLQRHPDSQPLSGFMMRIIVRYLISHFYINFSLLWKPVTDIICSHATANKNDDFWNVFFELLKNSSTLAQNSTWWHAPNFTTSSQEELDVFSSVVHGNYKITKEIIKEKPDYFNYRLLLWKTLHVLPYPAVIEGSSSLLEDLLFQYLENEFCFVNKQFSTDKSNETDDVSEEGSDGKSKVYGKKNGAMLLVTILQVFERFKNFHSFGSSSRLQALLDGMLSFPDPLLQQSALDFIFHLSNERLNKYKEQLSAICQEKNLRDAISHLSIADLANDDRQEIMPLLLKLLFGRLKSRGNATESRRSVIIRYLGCVNEQEIRLFINLITNPFKEYLDLSTDVEFVINAVRNNPNNLIEMVSSSQLLSILGTIKLLIEHHQQQLPEDVYTIIFRIIIAIYTLSLKKTDSDASPTTSKWFVSALKNIRKQALTCLHELLNAWPDSCSLAGHEIVALFDVVLLPELSTLDDCCGNDNPCKILKIFDMFAQKPKFMPLLVKETNKEGGMEHDASTSALHIIVSTLNSPNTSPQVSAFILDIFIHLVFKDAQDEVAEDSQGFSSALKQAVRVAGRLSINFKAEQLESRFHFGLAVTTTFLDEIVSYFIKKMQTRKHFFILKPIQLQLLCTVSGFISDTDLLSNLSELLLSHVVKTSKQKEMKRHNNEENQNTITAAMTALSHVMRGSKYIPKLSKLFSTITDRESRLVLVSILQNLCDGDNDLVWMLGIVTRMNAWDECRIEEVDFDSRLTAFQDIIFQLKADTYAGLFASDLFVILPIVHCCLHTLLTFYSDISLRENVLIVIGLITERVKDLLDDDYESGQEIYQSIIKNVLLVAVQSGLHSSKEGCRHESVKILSKVVETFPNEPTLHGLVGLKNSVNHEEDFFENVRHIQMHRRARAFRKLANILSSQNTTGNAVGHKNDANHIYNSTTVQYLLPLVVQPLYNDDLAKLTYLRDACIDVVKVCASNMKWPCFKRHLLKFIQKIESHPMTMKVVCAILKDFPFDLSRFTCLKLPNADDLVKPQEVDKDVTMNFSNVEKATEDDIDALDSEVAMDEPQDESVPEPTIYTTEAHCILTTVTQNILPKLDKILTIKENQHRLSHAKTDVGMYNRKVPLAIAMVSLLRKMPSSTLQLKLPRILLKIIQVLKHKLQDIRIIATDAMVKIFELLGPSYLFLLLKELKFGLTRGRQKHVLVHVVHCLMNSMRDKATVGVYDQSCQILLEIFNEGLFGATAAEKAVEKLRMKIPEARGRSKAFNAYKTLATFIGKDKIMSLIQPLKSQLDSTHHHATTSVVKEVLKEISSGLLANSQFDAIDVLTLTYGLVTENISSLFSEKPKKVKGQMKDDGRKPQSCLLIMEQPERYGMKSTRKTAQTNIHLLIEFALQLLHYSIKNQTIRLSNQSHLEMLDPFVDKLTQCLKSTHIQTAIDATRCLTKLFRAELPQMSNNVSVIVSQLFKFLREHSKGMGNQEMASTSFKSLSVFCSTNYGKSLSESQQQILITYAEEDLYDDQRQSRSFILIKALLNLGLQCNEIYDVIDKVRKIAIQSHVVSSRALARNLYLHFLVNYPLMPKKLAAHIEFILAQLSYLYEDGRMSTIELLSSIVSSFPLEVISIYAGIIFVPTAAVLVNDDSSLCRKAAATVIKYLLEKLEQETSDQLFSFVEQWLSDTDTVWHQHLAAMLVPVFAEVERSSFQRYLPTILPQILENIKQTNSAQDTANDLKKHDHGLFHHLSAFLALLNYCDISRSHKWKDLLNPVYDAAGNLLNHPHDWIQLVTAQIYGYLFATYEPSQLADSSYLSHDQENKMLHLSKCFCDQLKSDQLKENIAEQAIKNLLFIVRVFDWQHHDEVTQLDNLAPNVYHGILDILKQLLLIAKDEQTFHRKVTTKRVAVLKFTAAACLNLQNPQDVLEFLLEPVYRGMTTEIQGNHETESITELVHLATQVMEVVKNKVGAELFAKVYADVRQEIINKRRKWKMLKMRQLVSDPIKAATLKIKKHQQTRESRKRKKALRQESGRGKRIKSN